MSNEQTPIIRTVAATVTLKALEDDGWHLGLTIPELHANQYPLHVYQVPDADAGQVRKAGVYNVTLRRGALQNDKEGAPKNPKYDTSYRWEWVGLGGSTMPQAATGSTVPVAAPPPPREPDEPGPPIKNSRGLAMPREYAYPMLPDVERRVTFLACLGVAGPLYAGDTDEAIRVTTMWADAAFAYGRGDAQADGPGGPDAIGEPAPAAEPAPASQPPPAGQGTAPEPQNSGTPTTAAELKAAIEARGWTPEQISKALGGATLRGSWNTMEKQGVSEAMRAKNLWMSLVGALAK